MASAFENRLRRTIEMAGTDGQAGPVPVMATPSGPGVVLSNGLGLRTPRARGAVNSSQTGTAGADLLLASVVIPGGAIGPHAGNARFR